MQCGWSAMDIVFAGRFLNNETGFITNSLKFSQYGIWIVYLLCLPFVFGLLMLGWIYFVTIVAIVIGRLYLGYPCDYNHSCWNNSKRICWIFHYFVAKIWNGYEVWGSENLPVTKGKGALIITHHGTLIFEFIYFMAHMNLHVHSKFRVVIDRAMFQVPVYKDIIRLAQCVPGTYSELVELLKQGYCVILAPGGVYEAQFSNGYDLLWRKRTGFARAAIEAKVPIIPMFTMNCREAFRNVYLSKSLNLWLYEKTKLPTLSAYGGLPVKLKTYLGQPIPYDPSVTYTELVEKVKQCLESLIKDHQRIPGNIFMALMDRFQPLPKQL